METGHLADPEPLAPTFPGARAVESIETVRGVGYRLPLR